MLQSCTMKVFLCFLVLCLLQASMIVQVAEAQNITCPDGSLLGQKCYMECPDPSQVCFPTGSDIGFGSGTGHCCNVTSHQP
ncbi:hypothetical protein CHS0354_036353 [Potamilus streckersoni]|uniref:Uncharacterized protein n=1 Tax=Potamilus streckersoni TaxID=2493646 RepID=A0AAE0W1D7_9BIVA|nr:hypothetical protein CHS0354_036353 [Potamilus streckersoni]